MNLDHTYNALYVTFEEGIRSAKNIETILAPVIYGLCSVRHPEVMKHHGCETGANCWLV